MNSRTTQRRQHAIERTREDIMFAAARAIGRSGFKEATMRDIAREAGYTAASLYTYFKSKEEILHGFVELLHGQFMHSFDEPMPAGLTFRQRLLILLRRQLEDQDRHREIYSALMTAWMAPHVEQGRHGADEPFRRLRRFADWFEANATPADLGGHSSELAARFLGGVLISFMHRALCEGETGSVASQTEIIVDLFLGGVSGGGRSATRKTRAT